MKNRHGQESARPLMPYGFGALFAGIIIPIAGWGPWWWILVGLFVMVLLAAIEGAYKL